MSDNLQLDYKAVVQHYENVLDYCGKHSESFSVMTNLKKPYLKDVPECEHDDMMKDFAPYLIEQTVGLKEWPGTTSIFDDRKVMNSYRCCEATRKLLIALPNIFLSLQNKLPEDICFYRKRKPWMITVSHERLAFMGKATKEDQAFLERFDIVRSGPVRLLIQPIAVDATDEELDILEEMGIICARDVRLPLEPTEEDLAMLEEKGMFLLENNSPTDPKDG